MKKTGVRIFLSEEDENKLQKIAAKIIAGNADYDFILELKIKAKPGAKREEVFLKDNQLSVATFSIPEDGKANDGLTKTIALFLGVSAADCHLVQGQKSKVKSFKIGLKLKAKNDPEKVVGKLLALFPAIH